MKFKSYDIARFALDEADERFAPIFKPSAERLDIFRQYCDAFDRIMNECDGSTFEVEVDEITMNVRVKIEAEDITVDSPDLRFFTELIERAVSLTIRHGEGDTVFVQFTFPSLWEKTL